MLQQIESVEALAERVLADAEQKRDMVVDTRSLRMDADGNFRVDLDRIGTTHDLTATDTAHGQVAARLKIPAPYYERMRAEAPALLADNVNHWFTAAPERRMIRAHGTRMRAFLSDRYQRIDHADVLGIILPVLGEMPDLQVRSLAVTERRLYVRVTTPRVQGEVAKGDVVEAGLEITNSEIGLGALAVTPLVLRLVCLNGLVLPDRKLRQQHVGAQTRLDEGEVYKMLTDEALKADDHAFLLKVRDVVRGALSEATFQPVLERMRSAAGEPITGDPVKAVEAVGKVLSLTDGERVNVLRHLVTGGALSRWGLVNAVTRAAQDTEDYDRSVEMERGGGQVLTLPEGEWKRVAAAA